MRHAVPPPTARQRRCAAQVAAQQGKPFFAYIAPKAREPFRPPAPPRPGGLVLVRLWSCSCLRWRLLVLVLVVVVGLRHVKAFLGLRFSLTGCAAVGLRDFR